MQEHDELSIHGNADVISEFSHHAAFHFGLAARIYTHTHTQAQCRSDLLNSKISPLK